MTKKEKINFKIKPKEKIPITIKWLDKNLPPWFLDEVKWTPYKSLIFTILSARSKDERTLIVTEKIMKKYPKPKDLANADIEEIKTIIKSIGFYNEKSKRIKAAAKTLVEKFNSKVPDTFEELIEIEGVGRKTANVVLNNVFGKDVIGVDVHVHRISNRIGLVNTKKPEQTEIELTKITPKKDLRKINKLLVRFGQSICGPKPKCEICGLKNICVYYNKLN